MMHVNNSRHASTSRLIPPAVILTSHNFKKIDFTNEMGCHAIQNLSQVKSGSRYKLFTLFMRQTILRFWICTYVYVVEKRKDTSPDVFNFPARYHTDSHANTYLNLICLQWSDSLKSWITDAMLQRHGDRIESGMIKQQHYTTLIDR